MKLVKAQDPEQLTAHFHLREFKCHDGTEVPKKYRDRVTKLCTQLEVLREELGGPPIRIMSGYRPIPYNRRVGSSDRSQHVKARAADIKIRGVSPKKVHATIERLVADGQMEDGGLGLYTTFVHYDVRGRRARW